MDKSPKAWEEEVNQKGAKRTSKEFLAFLNTKPSWCNKAKTCHNTMKLWKSCTELQRVWVLLTPSGGSTKLAKLLCKERYEGEENVIVVAPSWSMSRNPAPRIGQRANPLHLDFLQGTHMGLMDVSKAKDTQPPWILYLGRIQTMIKQRFIPHHLVFKDGIELLQFTKRDRTSSLTHYVQNFNQMLTMVPLKKEFARKLVFMHGLKPWVQKLVH
jgi:hypothetical protein